MKRKIFNLVLIILAAFIFSPVIGHAQTEDEYPIWVGEVQVTESNKNDVLGTSDEGATVVYNAEKNLLILNNANIKVGKKVDKDNHQTFRVAIYSTEDLNINIKGNNSLGEYDETKYTVDNWYVTDGYSINYGVWLENGNLTFVKSDGNGTLNIIDYSDGIKADDITFNNDFGKLKIDDRGSFPQEDVPPCAISASGDVVINGGLFELKSELQNGITANKVIINGGLIKIWTNSDKNTISSNDEIIIDDNLEVINAEYIKGSTSQLSVSNFDIDDGFVTIRETKKTIIYNSNGGSSVNSQEVSYGNKITKPTNPTKENYVFDGWYIDEQLSEQFDFNTTITNDITLYAKWREAGSFSYEFINGDKQELTIGNLKSFILKIDGDYSLFESLKIGDLELIKDEDYEVTEGSTVITFTDKGIAKLNTLSKGEYEILVKYSNDKEVKGKVILKSNVSPNSDIENPKTGDNYITYLIIVILSLIGIIGISYFNRKEI